MRSADETIDGQKTDEHSLELEETATPDSRPTVKTKHVLDDDDRLPVRPKRTRKPPGHLRDVIVGRVPMAGLATEARSPSKGDQTPTAPGQLLTPKQADRLLNPWGTRAI